MQLRISLGAWNRTIWCITLVAAVLTLASLVSKDWMLIGPRHFKYASRHMSCIITQFLIYMVWLECPFVHSNLRRWNCTLCGIQNLKSPKMVHCLRHACELMMNLVMTQPPVPAKAKRKKESTRLRPARDRSYFLPGVNVNLQQNTRLL
jgi:hypothetical protein